MLHVDLNDRIQRYFSYFKQLFHTKWATRLTENLLPEPYNKLLFRKKEVKIPLELLQNVVR